MFEKMAKIVSRLTSAVVICVVVYGIILSLDKIHQHFGETGSTLGLSAVVMLSLLAFLFIWDIADVIREPRTPARRFNYGKH